MLDELRLSPVSLVPEIRLHLAEDAILFWARMEADMGAAVPAPYWASAWVGGQALARYLLDHPAAVSGKRVLDLGSGSGLAAIAAALAGAASVTANDIDPFAIAVIGMNAAANHVTIVPMLGDMLDDHSIEDVDVILVGDTLYSEPIARSVLRFMRRQRRRGAEILLGDPGRGHLPASDLAQLATYSLIEARAFSDAQLSTAEVFRLR